MRSDPLEKHPVIVGTALVILGVATAMALPRVSGTLETATFRSVNELPQAFYWPLWIVMQLGNMFIAPIAACIALALKKPRLALELTIAGLGAWLVAKVIKSSVGRARPGKLLDEVTLRETTDAENGYVSGHAAVAFALAVVLLPLLPRPWRAVVLVTALLVGIGRIYVGAHLPLDVVGGASLGIAIGGVTSLLLRERHPADGEAVEEL